MKKKEIILSYIAIFIITPISCMELPDDIWHKIIAFSTTKNQFACISTQFNQISKRTNICLYIQSPLMLSNKDLQFGLICATYYGKIDAVKNLLQHGAQQNHGANQNHDNTETVPLYAQAIYCGDLATLKNYVENIGNAPPYIDYNTNPILHSAIVKGHTHIVEYLLKDPHAQPYITRRWYEMTPLYYGARHNRPAITQLLLQADSSIINDVCDRGFTPFHVAVHYRHYYLAEIFAQHPETKINFCTNFQRSPLHTAVRNADVNMVNLLLSLPRIILNIRNRNNRTPLDVAKKREDKETCNNKKQTYATIRDLLIKKGAKTFFYLDKIALWEKNRKNIVKTF